MIERARRRLVGLTALGMGSAISFLLYTVYTLSLWRTNYATGWTLFILLIGLIAFNARKKLPVVPLGSASLWLQVHSYVGVFSVVMFALHVDLRLPNGPLEASLSALYGMVVASGLIGLVVCRSFAKRLLARGEQVIFERQPTLLRRLRDNIEALMARGPARSSLSDFYAARLMIFFAKPRHLWRHLMQSTHHCDALLSQLDALGRYVSPEEREIKDRIAGLIRAKNDLDYHYAHQLVLKYWLFVHIPLSYSLLIVALVHGTLAYVHRGSP